MRFLDLLRQAADPLVYAAILLVFAVGIIRCVAPVAANRRQILRGIRRVRSAATRNDWQEDTFLGKKCHKYSYETTQKRKTATWTVWVYKGFILKSISKLGRRESVIEVTELKENASVPAEVFDIP